GAGHEPADLCRPDPADRLAAEHPRGGDHLAGRVPRDERRRRERAERRHQWYALQLDHDPRYAAARLPVRRAAARRRSRTDHADRAAAADLWFAPNVRAERLDFGVLRG